MAPSSHSLIVQRTVSFIHSGWTVMLRLVKLILEVPPNGTTNSGCFQSTISQMPQKSCSINGGKNEGRVSIAIAIASTANEYPLADF